MSLPTFQRQKLSSGMETGYEAGCVKCLTWWRLVKMQGIKEAKSKLKHLQVYPGLFECPACFLWKHQIRWQLLPIGLRLPVPLL